MFLSINNYFLFRQILGAIIFLSNIQPILKIFIILLLSLFGKQLLYSGPKPQSNNITLFLKVNSIVAYLQILLIIIDEKLADKITIQLLIFALGIYSQHKLQKLL